MPSIETQTRQDIAAFLPCAIRTALESYQYFSQAQITDPESSPCSKKFKDHHDACKVAIAHIKLLIELAKWADIPPPEMENELEQSVLRAVIENARGELDGGQSE